MESERAEVVLVTGAAGGIGRGVLDAFWQRGALVVAADRRVERLDELRRHYGERFHATSMDVRDAEEVGRCIDDLPPEFSEINILVNNAGLALGLERAPYTSLEDWKRMVDTNVSGILHVLDAVLPGMVARNRGHVINMGSVAADTAYAGGNVYGASKAFIRQLSLNLRADLLGTDVRVTCIEPGMVKSEFLQVRFGGDAERAEAMYQEVDHLTVSDIADIVLFVTSVPPRVSISLLQVMPTQQAHAGYAFAAPVELKPESR